MKLLVAVAVAWLIVASAQSRAAEPVPTAAQISKALQEITLDPDRTYNVRELRLIRGDIKLYFTEGTLSFATPVAGRRVSAIFTTKGAEAGDAEVMVLPPNRSERASLARFTKSPNLDEHFDAALLIFSDDTARELVTQIEASPVRKAPERTAALSADWDRVLHNISADLQVQVIQSLLDGHKPDQGFFYGLIGGRNLVPFDIEYQPRAAEPVVLGRVTTDDGPSRFELWTTFRPKKSPPHVPDAASIGDYRLDATISEDLSLKIEAHFHFDASPSNGRVIPLELSDKLRVSSAKIDGQPAEVMERASIRLTQNHQPGIFLVVSPSPLVPGSRHLVEVSYSGSVVQKTADGSYFVDERNTWFPRTGPLTTGFDLIFHCPARLRLVSTGELIEETVANGVRTVHRRTQVPEHYAGFNLGEYQVLSEDRGQYRLECYANDFVSGKPDRTAFAEAPPRAILRETGELLDRFTRAWHPLSIHTVAVSPIPGYFGQGFPGLIYLSNVAYLRKEDRPANLRNPISDAFFSQMLLPHETAHQWWGNVVTSADYRSEWLIEAMANYAALEVLRERKGQAAEDEVLEQYRRDLLFEKDGQRLESAGPVVFGTRLADSVDLRTWQTIVYEKGTWILHMLRERLGAEAFTRFQERLLQDFAVTPFQNEDLQTTAARFVPPGQPDKTLDLFFETWVKGVGIPSLQLNQKGRRASIEVSRVEDDFTMDLPLRCGKSIEWIRVSAGANSLELPPGRGACQLPSRNEFLFTP